MSESGHTHEMRAHSSVWPAAVQPGSSDGLGWALSHIWGLAETMELTGLCSFLQPASPGVLLQRVEKQGRDQKFVRLWRQVQNWHGSISGTFGQTSHMAKPSSKRERNTFCLIVGRAAWSCCKRHGYKDG